MSKKIPKLIIYGITTIPTTTTLACGESISIEDKSQLIIKTKSKQKDIINKIISPNRDDKKHDAKLFDVINLVKTNAIKAIDNIKTIASAIKVGKKAIVDIEKAIKNYNDSKGEEYKLQVDKAKFNSFKHLIVGKAIPILEDGPTTAEELTALMGHGSIPAETLGVIRTFAIQTNAITKIATITITFTTRTSSDTTTYKISGFETININVQYGFMYQIKEGTIYVETYNEGLKKFKDNTLKNIDTINSKHNFMHQTKDGIIYVGTYNEGIFELVDNTLIDVKPSSLPSSFKFDPKNNIFGNNFIYQTQEGTIYVGTYVKGLQKLVNDKENGGKKLVLVDKIDVNSGFMYQTKDGTIYLGTKYNGFWKLVDDKLISATSFIDVYTGFMYQTSDNTIYLGTWENGLKKLVDDEKGGKKLVDVVSIDVSYGFMYQTKDGTIYVGTNNKGLKKLVNDKLIDIDSTDVINGFMYQTKDDTIYLGTKNGLKKFPKS